MRVLGLDVGDKRIGVAMSDPGGSIAGPLAVIESRRGESALSRVVALAEEHEVGQIVVGLPRSLDGSLGPQAQKVQAFIELLRGLIDVPIVTWDERLSTVAADRLMAEAGVRRNKRKGRRDSLAAAFILQGYLDRENK